MSKYEDSNNDFKTLFYKLISQYELSPDVAEMVLQRILIVLQEQDSEETAQ